MTSHILIAFVAIMEIMWPSIHGMKSMSTQAAHQEFSGSSFFQLRNKPPLKNQLRPFFVNMIAEEPAYLYMYAQVFAQRLYDILVIPHEW